MGAQMLMERNLIYTTISVLVLRAGQLGALEKCASRLEGNNLVSNCTNLNSVSNNKHCKYYRVILSSFGQTNQLTIVFIKASLQNFRSLDG